MCTLLNGCLQTTFTMSHFRSRRLEVKRSLSNILMEVGRTESRLSTFDINIDATRNTWKRTNPVTSFFWESGRHNFRFKPWSLPSLKLNCWQVLRWKHCDNYRCEYLKSSPPFQTKNKENGAGYDPSGFRCLFLNWQPKPNLKNQFKVVKSALTVSW